MKMNKKIMSFVLALSLGLSVPVFGSETKKKESWGRCLSRIVLSSVGAAVGGLVGNSLSKTFREPMTEIIFYCLFRVVGVNETGFKISEVILDHENKVYDRTGVGSVTWATRGLGAITGYAFTNWISKKLF